MQRYFQVTPPVVHQMVLNLSKLGLLTRVARCGSFPPGEHSDRRHSAPGVARLRNLHVGASGLLFVQVQIAGAQVAFAGTMLAT